MTIFDKIVQARKGQYVHALEVATPYEIEIAIECIWSEFEDSHTIDDLKDFFNSMEIYYYAGEEIKEDEDAVYNFCIDSFIDANL